MMGTLIQRVALDLDTLAVHKAIRQEPGIPSKRAIAEATGLTLTRIDRVIKHGRTNDMGLPWIDYGEIDGKRGWYEMNTARHFPVLKQADAHAAAIENGLRRASHLEMLRIEDLKLNDSDEEES